MDVNARKEFAVRLRVLYLSCWGQWSHPTGSRLRLQIPVSEGNMSEREVPVSPKSLPTLSDMLSLESRGSVCLSLPLLHLSPSTTLQINHKLRAVHHWSWDLASSEMPSLVLREGKAVPMVAPHSKEGRASHQNSQSFKSWPSRELRPIPICISKSGQAQQFRRTVSGQHQTLWAAALAWQRIPGPLSLSPCWQPCSSSPWGKWRHWLLKTPAWRCIRITALASSGLALS